MRRSAGLLGWTLLALLAPVSARAAAGTLLTEDAADDLRPGQSLWTAEEARDGPVTVVVSVAAQRAYVYRAGALLGVSTVSTGKRGHSTPVGGFSILEKQRYHRSNLYSNAPMPYMQRLTWSGVALHEGQLPGYPASHGCIRLPREFAVRLFGTTRLGSAVIVTDYDARLPAETRIDAPPRLEYDYVWDEGGGSPGGALR